MKPPTPRASADRPSARQVPRWSVRRLAIAAIAAGLTLFLVPSLSGGAQDTGEIEELKEERRRVQDAAAAQAVEVNAASAEVGELTEALAALQTLVNAAQGRLDEAQRNLADAEARQAAAEASVVEQRSAIAALKVRLAERAVESFVNQGDDGSIIVRSADPSEAVRMQALVKNVNQSEADVVEALRGAEEDLVIQERLAVEVTEEAAIHRDSVGTELTSLESARASQAVLTDEAEARLDAELSEADALAELDADVSARISLKAERLAEELARKATPPSGGGGSGGGGSGGGSTGPPAGSSDIVTVRGIQVNRSIAEAVENLLAAAEGDGISLSGSGYRSADGQIAVRKSNCGTSEYAIWQMPPSQCRPPTARPGASQHERGLAIDLTYNGGLIRSRSNAGFVWLAANAASYGFFNLPSEPWHWSTNGS